MNYKLNSLYSILRFYISFTRMLHDYELHDKRDSVNILINSQCAMKCVRFA
jgi:hypothetical protein